MPLIPPPTVNPNPPAPGARYTGPAYPIGPTPAAAFGPKDDVHVIFTSIVNIITTPLGLQPYDLNLGSQIPYLVFDIGDEIGKSLVRHFTYKALTEQEPRIVVRNVSTQQQDAWTVVVMVGFSIVGDSTAAVYNAPMSFALAA
jgi:phage baseplate assembly protein W